MSETSELLLLQICALAEVACVLILCAMLIVLLYSIYRGR